MYIYVYVEDDISGRYSYIKLIAPCFESFILSGRLFSFVPLGFFKSVLLVF